jgi:hypothetical protein
MTPWLTYIQIPTEPPGRDTILDTTEAFLTDWSMPIAILIVTRLVVAAIRAMGGAAAGLFSKFNFIIGVVVVAAIAVGLIKLFG